MKRRADGRYQKRITLPNGKSKLLYSSASNERLAVKDFNEQMLKLEKDQKNSTLFEVVAENWRNKHFDSLQNNTLKQYRACYNDLVDFFNGYKIEEIDEEDIDKYIDTLKNKGYAYKTIKNRFSVLQQIFKYAILKKLLKNNPCLYVTMPKKLPKTKRKPATKEDEKRICNSTDSLCGVLAYLYLTTGCRRGEALALTPKDVDLENKTVLISKTVEWLEDGKPRIKPNPKTDAGDRKIPLNEKTLSLLKPFLNQKYLFQNEDGNLLSNWEFTKLWATYKKETGIECTPHQLRHSYATMLFDADVDIKTAQRWLGHADINTTLAVYTHLSQFKLEKVSQKFTEYLDDNF